VSNASVTINNGVTTLVGYTTSSARLELSSLTLNGGLLTHYANLTTQSHIINISATNITINSGGKINVDGRGYPPRAGSSNIPNNGPGGGYNTSFLSTGGGGGGHGGSGGYGADGDGYGGAAYCAVSNISTMGSSGGNGPSGTGDGGAGGGLVILNATSTLTFNGTIIAQGTTSTNGSSSGGGAGGGIKLSASIVTGTPTLFSAQGGAGIGRGGGGGGGCVQISYASSTSITTSNVAGGARGGVSFSVDGSTGLLSASSSIPTAPSSLYTSNTDASAGSTNPSTLTTLTPVFSAVCNSPSNCTAAEIEVSANSDYSSPRWQSGQVDIVDIANGVRSESILYAGSQLNYNTTYYWRIRFYNSSGVGSYTTSTNTFYAPRTLEMFNFSLGGSVQSGQSIPIMWGSLGGSSTTSETVKLEYSTDGFVTDAHTITTSAPSPSSTSAIAKFFQMFISHF
jgi:hypothetical protein